MKILSLFLLIMFSGHLTVWAGDIMSLFDESYKLQRQILKQQVQFLMQRDDGLRGFPVAYFDKPSPNELYDRAAFEFLWNKKELHSVFNSYVFGVRAALSPDEQKQVLASHPELANFQEAEGVGGALMSMPQAKAVALSVELSGLDEKYHDDLNSLSRPLQQKINSINAQIGSMIVAQKHKP